MNEAEFLRLYVEFSGNQEVTKLKATDANDVVSLVCEEVEDNCVYTVNGYSHPFHKDKLRVKYIETGDGDDSIKVVISKEMMRAIEIRPGEGNNIVDAKFVAPKNRGEVVLGKGKNNVVFDEEGSNLYIKWGFCHSKGNRIQIKSNKYALEDIEVLRESNDSQVFDVFLKHKADEKTQICSISNHLSPSEYDAYAELGEGSNLQQYAHMSYVINGPRDLAETMVQAGQIVISAAE